MARTLHAMALIVNGEEIDDEIIENEFRTIKGHFERTLQVACCERDPEFRAMAKDNIASRILIQQEAIKRVPEVSDEAVHNRLQRLIAQAGGEEQFYLQIGMPLGEADLIRDQVSNGERMDQMMNAVYAPEPSPTDEELRAYYDTNLKQYLTDEQIRVSHISLNLSGAKSRLEVYNQMRELREKALVGADFDALGAEHNSNKDTPPDLGWFKRGEFMEEFEAIAFSMSKGEVSPVFVTQLGFHIAKLTDRKPAEPRPFDEVKELVRQHILEKHKDDKFNAFVEGLKKAAEIKDTDPDGDCGCPGGH